MAEIIHRDITVRQRQDESGGVLERGPVLVMGWVLAIRKPHRTWAVCRGFPEEGKKEPKHATD